MASCADMKAPKNLLQSERGKVPLSHRPGEQVQFPMGASQDTARGLHLITVGGIKSSRRARFL